MSGSPIPYKQILELGRDGITINSDRTLLYVNESFAKMVGYSVEELVGMDIFHITASNHWENVAEKTRRRQAGDQVEAQYELELVRKDGTRLPVEFSVSNIDYMGKSSSLTIIRDISVRINEEKARVESEERFRGFMQSALEGIAIFDKTLHYSEVNESWLKLSGLNRDHVIGKHLLKVFPSMKESGRFDTYMEVLESGNPVVLHGIQSASKRGRILDVSVFTTGEILGVISRDVTNREYNQRRLEALHIHAAKLATLNSKESVAYTTMEILRDLLGFKVGSFGFVEDGKIIFTEFREESSITELDLDGQGITVRAVNTGETQLVYDTLKDFDYISGRVKEDVDTLSELDVPIKVGESVVALINLESNEVGTFQLEDQRIVETLGMHVGSSLDRIARENVIKETLNELRASEALFRGFIQSATERFILFDTDLSFLVVNDSWLHRAGLQREDVIGKHVLDVFPDLKESGQYAAYLKVLETGEPAEIRALDSVTKQGTIIDLTIFKTGDNLGMVARDVSDRVKYSRRLEALIEHATQLNNQESVEAVISVTFNIIEDLFGYNYGSFGIVEGDSIHHVIVPQVDHIDDFYQPINGEGICPRAVRSGETQVVNETRIDPDFTIAVAEGVYEPRSELVAPIIIDGSVEAILNVESLSPGAFSDNDVRLVELLANHVGSALFRLRADEEKASLEGELVIERMRVDQEQELSMLKTRFMSTATHEIRTPLASILGYTELIQDDQDSFTDDQKLYFEVIQRNVHRLSVLTDDLLDLQRLEEDRMGLNIESVNVRELVGLVETEFTPMLAKKEQVLLVSCGDVVVNIDRLRLMQVLVNLLSNASKFSPMGSEILIEVEEIGDSVRFSIVDSGIGMGIEDLGKLFSPFPSIVRDFVTEKSTGLGLSICKGIVELHNGSIWAESEGKGKGSTFTFTIPR